MSINFYIYLIFRTFIETLKYGPKPTINEAKNEVQKIGDRPVAARLLIEDESKFWDLADKKRLTGGEFARQLIHMALEQLA
jgi:hypothetical protein